MSRVLIALAIVAAVLALTKPWDASGGGGAGGPKAVLVASLKTEMAAHGVPDEFADCFTGNVEDDLTDADAAVYSQAILGGRAAAEADPVKQAAVIKVGLLGMDCAGELADGLDADQLAALAAEFGER